MNAFIPHSFPGNGIGNGMRNRTNLRMEKTPRDRESLILTDHGRREFVGNFLIVGNLLPSRGNQSSAILSWWVYADGQFVETRLLGSGHKIRTSFYEQWLGSIHIIHWSILSRTRSGRAVAARRQPVRRDRRARTKRSKQRNVRIAIIGFGSTGGAPPPAPPRFYRLSVKDLYNLWARAGNAQ
jgi:hypothetical protein